MRLQNSTALRPLLAHRILSLFLLGAPALTISIAGPAVAQDDDDEDFDDIPDLDESGDDDSSDTADAGDDEGDTDTEEGQPEASGEDAAAEPGAATPEQIFAVQYKARLVGGSFEISPQFIQSVNNRFVSHTGMMLSVVYNLGENMAVQGSLGGFGWWDSTNNRPYLGGKETATTKELRDRERLAPELVKLLWHTWVATADLQWSPVYGKVSVHDAILGSFNVYLSVGAGLTGLGISPDSADVTLPGPFDSPLPPMTITTTFGGGLRFYFLDWLGVRFELRDYVSALSMPTSIDGVTLSTFEVRNTLLAQLGLSFVF